MFVDDYFRLPSALDFKFLRSWTWVLQQTNTTVGEAVVAVEALVERTRNSSLKPKYLDQLIRNRPQNDTYVFEE